METGLESNFVYGLHNFAEDWRASARRCKAEEAIGLTSRVRMLRSHPAKSSIATS